MRTDAAPAAGSLAAPGPAIDTATAAAPGIALPPLLAACAIALWIGVDPRLLAGADGRADHAAASALFAAMSAGFVRGLGFVPRHWLARRLLSGWGCAAWLALAVALRFAR